MQKKMSGKILRVFLTLTFFAPSAYSLPQGERVESGEVSFERPDETTLNVTASDQAIVGWESFSITTSETVNFLQPSVSASVLNRVFGGGVSEIFGTLNATGRIFLENPNGIVFGPSASVNVGSLIASSLHLDNENFLSGRYSFTEELDHSPSFVINEGRLMAREGGGIALLGGAVENTGTIEAKLGSIALASGEKMTLSFDHNGLISVVVDEGVQEAVVGPNGTLVRDGLHQAGKILAEGGKVKLTAESMAQVFDRLVNQEGVIEAESVVEREGVIELVGSGGLVRNAGSLRADGTLENPDGGRVEITGDWIVHRGQISASAGDHGTAGDIRLISNLGTLLTTGSVIEAKGALVESKGGNVLVNSLAGNTEFRSGALIDVSGGTLSGDAGFIDVSAHDNLGIEGRLLGIAQPGFQGGRLLFDPFRIRVRNPGVNVVDGGDAAVGFPDETFAESPGATLSFNPQAGGAFAGFQQVFLQATQDILIESPFDVPTAVGGLGIPSLRLEAGRDIRVNQNLSTTGQDIVLSANRNISVAAARSVTILGAGNLAITADADNSNNGTFVMNAGASLSTGSGDITLNGAQNMNLRTVTSTSGTISASSSGNVRVSNSLTTGGTGAITVTGDDNSSGAGTFVQDIGSTISTSGGLITITGADDMTIRTINAGTGNVTLTGNSAGTDIFDDGNNATKITGNVLTLNAAGRLGNSGATAQLDASVNELNATASAGSIFVRNDKALLVPMATASGAGNDITLITTSGNLTLGALTAADDFTLTAAGAVLSAGSLITGDRPTITAGTDIGSLASPLNFAVNSWILTANTGSVHARVTTGNFTVNTQAIAGGVSTFGTSKGNVRVSSASGDLTLEAGAGNVTATPNLSFVDGDLALRAAGDLTLNGNVTTTGTGTQTLVADSDSNGAGTFSQAAGKTISATSGSIVISSAGNPVVRTASNTGTMNITSTTGGFFNNTTSLSANTLTLASATDIGTNISAIPTNVSTLNASVSGAGNIFISEANDLTLGAVTTANGSIGVTAGGTLTASNASVIANGAGQDISLTTTAGNILVGLVQAADDITLTSAGAIEEFSPDAGFDIIGDEGQFTAASGIGTLDPIEISLNTLGANNTGASAINLTETDALVVNSITSGGSVNLVTGGDLVDGNGALNNITASADSTLTAGATIGSAADPLDVTVAGATLGITAPGQAAGVSAAINGTVTPSNTLLIFGTPPGMVLFNGVNLLAVAGAIAGGGGAAILGNDLLFSPFFETILEPFVTRRFRGFTE